MRILCVFALYLVSLGPAWSQVPVEGQLRARQACEAFTSIRKRSNPGAWQLTPGRDYPLVAENRPEGSWWLVRIEGQTRWVAKSCGEASLIGKVGPSEPVTRGEGADFDHYTLAMSWHSGFCAGAGRRPECRKASGELVLHGLWPSNRQGPHPAWCGGEARQGFCAYPALSLEGEQEAALASVMPGVASCLGRYQWQKHGRCSGLPLETYFERAIRYSRWLRDAPPARQMRQHAGQTLSRSELQRWFRQWGVEVSLHCRQDRLEEIRLRLRAPLPPQPSLSAVEAGADRSRCPEEIRLLP